LGFGTFLTPANAASGPKSVLLLVTGQSGILEVDEAVAGVRTILQSQFSSPLTLYTEYLDQDRFGSEYLQRLPYWYLEKYRSHKPDVIVAGGGSVLDFLLRSRLRLWPRVPIVFSSLDERIRSRAPVGEQITGIVFSRDVQKLLAGALRLLPDTERVAFVSGSALQGQYCRNRYRQEVDQYGKQIAFLDFMGLPMRDLRNRLANLPRNTMVFYSPMDVDGAGRFGMDEAPLGYGIVGGRLVSYWEMGRQVARLVLRILQGESASDIPIQTSSGSVLAFDWRQLRNWDIDQSRLNREAIVRFRQASPWERYWWLILATIAFCIIQTSLITGLLYQRWHRKRAAASLDEPLQFETLVADTSAILSNLPVSDVDGHIRDCLGRIARFLKADRGSLWRWTADGRFVATHSWWCEGVDPPPLSVAANSYAGLKGALQRGAVVVSRLEDLPGDANREGIRRFGARSLAVAPLSVGGKSIGALVFVTTKSECTWPEGLAQRLQTLGDIFAVHLARKESEISVRQSEELSSAVLASLEENVTVLDREGFILRTSPTPALKASGSGCGPLVQTPAVGRNYLKLWRLVSSDVNSDPIGMVDAVRRVLQDRERVAVLEYRDPAVPEGRWFEVRIHRLERPEGGAVVTHLDISNRKRAEIEVRRNLDEIAHLNRVAAMGELTASVAHEINQPLTAILSNAQAACRLLNSKSPDLTEVRECLADIIADDKRAGEVIKQLRALLKKGEFQASEVDLNEVVRDVIRLVGHDALLRKASVVFEPLPGLPPVLGDRIQLYQVALNLIVNGLAAAAEQSPHDRWLLVRTGDSKGSGVELTVEDSGKGIAESDLPHVFEPFFTTKQEGLGMGLSISRSIVQAHGGHLSAENSAGGGAIFRCVLPAAPQAAMVSAP
jgi:signal transduction histidine kinase